MEKKIIKLAIKNGLFHLLNKSACQMSLNEMLVNKELTIHDGVFYINNDSLETMTLEDCVKRIIELFSYTRTGIKGKNRDQALITKKLKRFKLETGLTYEEIIKVADYYVENYNTISGYLVMAKYFFYKQDRKKDETSWAKGILELWKEQELEQKSFNTNMDD